MKACVYTRISLDPNAGSGDDATGQDTSGQGVARQEADCRALTDRLGGEVSDVYCDNDLSAYTGKVRPGFEEMLDAIKRGQYDALICWHTDRLTRSMKDLERVIEVCDAANVPIHTVNGGDLDLSTATGKMLARILGSVSRQESEHKAERQRRANIQRAEAGGWWSSHRVFGYTMKGELEPAEADLVRQAAVDVLSGKSLTAVAREWNTAGALSPRGKRWTVSAVKRLLVRPRYAAIRTYRGKVVGDGDWPAIIDRDTHAGLVAMLTSPDRGGNVSWERKYLGSYRYICGRCGSRMTHALSSHSAGGSHHRYRCTAKAHLARSQPDLDAHVEAVALGWLRDTERLHRILGAQTADGVDLDALRARRSALIAQKDELAAMFTDGVLDGPAVRRESAKLGSKIADIDKQLAESVRRNPVLDLLAEGAEKVEERWAAASPDRKGKLIDELFTVVVNPAPKGRYFNPEYVDIRWHKGVGGTAG